MEITNVRLHRMGPPGQLRAYSEVEFDRCFVVKNVLGYDGRRIVIAARDNPGRLRMLVYDLE